MVKNKQPRRYFYSSSVPLLYHIESRLEAQDEAVLVAKREMERRMDGFPDQFVRKGDSDIELTKMKSQIELLMEAKAMLEGKASQRGLLIALAMSAISILIASIVGIASLMRHFQV